MKATIDVPNDLYRRVKARAALLGRPVREVTIELYQRWLGEAPTPPPGESPEEWLNRWEETGVSLLRAKSDGPTATEILTADRDRLDHR
jgi:hypothetical protein